ncbi:MAG: hypothetical protein N2544_06870 [Burkholderiales bacterium]|nr:hypothetical protein [Burkholderiales bacterium]
MPESRDPDPAAAGVADPALGLSLVRGDALFRLQRRVGLIPAHGLGLVRRAVFWSLFAWLPVVLWAIHAGRALPGVPGEPLLAHFGIHARFLVAVPLLILAEGPVHAASTRLLGYFAASGVVPPAETGRFRAAVAATARLRDGTLPWIVIAGLVLGFTTTSEIVHHAHEIDWADGGAGDGRWGFGALWYLYVGRSVYLTLVLAWLWRAVLLAVLLWRIARLDLALVPTHPDRAGGVGFLERVPPLFAPVVLGIGCVIASRWAHDAVYHGLALQSLRVEMAAFVAAALAVFLLPLAAFAGPLMRAKRQALLDYGALVGRHGRLVRERWIEGKTVDDAVLGAPELGPVADTVTAYEAVKAMRAVPVGKAAVVPLAAAAAAPMIALLALQMPVKDLALALVKALL